MSDNGTLLSVKELRTYFETEDGTVKAVDGISFDLKRGETLGIVGESGSGKSVTNLSILRLIPTPPGRIVSGEVLFQGQDILSLPAEDVRRIRGKRISMIFQDPMTSLNPFMRISKQLMELTRLHLGHTKQEAYEHAVKMLDTVGIPEARVRVDSYPHEFSGGMRQRVMIAMALSCEPELLIADEPTTALDVTIQAQILELIKKLKVDTGTSVILITHDLGVVAGMTDHIIVMYAGKVFEQAPTRELFEAPGNPYTKGLLKSVPDPLHAEGTELYQIPGLPPDVAHLPPGCPFAPRCYRAEEVCRREFPPFVKLNAEHFSLCHFAEEVYADSRAGRTDRTGDEAAAPPPPPPQVDPSEMPLAVDPSENPEPGGTDL
ncbi:MAG TPA: ABC transporter ATP-binding protein [Pyrinomonadaceae bacterium]|jgi:oligopeptide transport system ATP-binding protein|nr:ABC transporter ATP-binding protein [Pyrinomonadaceae bacterium]